MHDFIDAVILSTTFTLTMAIIFPDTLEYIARAIEYILSILFGE